RTANDTGTAWERVTSEVGQGFSSVIQNLDGMVSGMAFALSRLIPTGGGNLWQQIGMTFVQNLVGGLASAAAGGLTRAAVGSFGGDVAMKPTQAEIDARMSLPDRGAGLSSMANNQRGVV